MQIHALRLIQWQACGTRGLVALLVLLFQLACGAAVPPEPGTGGAPSATNAPAKASVPQCWSDCQCQRGFYCDNRGQCSDLDFSPHYPPTSCFASCQCPGSAPTCTFQGNYFGECTAPASTCQSDCDCGQAAICNRNTRRCELTFGPYPECRCDQHCPN